MKLSSSRRYQVEQNTLSGWANMWGEEMENGEVTFQTFASRREAVAAIDEFLTDVQSAMTAGFMDDNYRKSHFRVRLVPEATKIIR